MGEKLAVYREEHFNAAHRLNNPAWSPEQNKRVFGKCNLPNYHGHNYVLIVKVVGEVDPETGYVMDKFDHKNLNLDVPAFANLNPSAENIAIVIFGILRPLINEHLDLQVRLYETPRNFVEYPYQLK